ncbi:hypothetical protein F2P81_010915 [Scophthalmus maximus]|uniref:Uncharacterized protein n=1 Tax=Scophthalmus maximus TaxID=52904 RepID=A0A6A4T4B1_SCOMX|nr:hypothetical protein F2P81_010915 [Scophthalmus maximus]
MAAINAAHDPGERCCSRKTLKAGASSLKLLWWWKADDPVLETDDIFHCGTSDAKRLKDEHDMSVKVIVVFALLVAPLVCGAASSSESPAAGEAKEARNAQHDALQQLLAKRERASDAAHRRETAPRTRSAQTVRRAHLSEDEREIMTKQIMQAISEDKYPEAFCQSILQLFLPYRVDEQLRPPSFEKFQQFYENGHVRLSDGSMHSVKDVVDVNRVLFEIEADELDKIQDIIDSEGLFEDAWCELCPEKELERLECAEELKDRQLVEEQEQHEKWQQTLTEEETVEDCFSLRTERTRVSGVCVYYGHKGGDRYCPVNQSQLEAEEVLCRCIHLRNVYKSGSDQRALCCHAQQAEFDNLSSAQTEDMLLKSRYAHYEYGDKPTPLDPASNLQLEESITLEEIRRAAGPMCDKCFNT